MSGKKLGLDKQYKNLYTNINKNSPSGLSKGITKPFKSTGKRIMENPIIGSKLLSQFLNTGGLSEKQKAIAAKAPPANKLDGKDFAVLRAEKAKDRGMGLQDEKMKPGKVMKARVGRSIERKKSNLVKKTPIRDFIKDTLEGKYMDKKKGTAESLEMIFNKYKSIKRKKGGEIIKANKGLHAEKKKDENDMSKLPKGLRKDTTTGFGKNIKKIKDE